MCNLSKKEQIVEVAKDIFLMKGVEKTRVEDITKSLGIAKGSFYRYFKTKEELLEAILDEIYLSREKELEDILTSNLSYKEKLERFIIDRYVISLKRVKQILILVNLAKYFTLLSTDVMEKIFKIEELNKTVLKKILQEIPDKNYTQEELQLLVVFMMGGIRNYVFEKLFFKNSEEYFISSLEEFKNKIKDIELEKELKKLVDLII